MTSRCFGQHVELGCMLIAGAISAGCGRAIPETGRTRAAVISALKTIAEAEEHYKATLLKDTDGDGVGEYVNFIDISGRSDNLVKSFLPMVPDAYLINFDTYDILLCLPGENVRLPAAALGSCREEWWWCYALPRKRGRSASEVLLIDETGQLFCGELAGSAGDLNPFAGVRIEVVAGRPQKKVLWRALSQ